MIVFIFLAIFCWSGNCLGTDPCEEVCEGPGGSEHRPYPGDCLLFCHCTESTGFCKSCPPGTGWCDERSLCCYTPDCEVPPACPGVCKIKPPGHHLYPGDCEKYCYCEEGEEALEKDCPIGAAWCPDTKYCCFDPPACEFTSDITPIHKYK